MKTAPTRSGRSIRGPRDGVSTDQRGGDRVVRVAAGQKQRRVGARRADQDPRAGCVDDAIPNAPTVSSVIGSAAARAATRFSPSM